MQKVWPNILNCAVFGLSKDVGTRAKPVKYEGKPYRNKKGKKPDKRDVSPKKRRRNRCAVGCQRGKTPPKPQGWGDPSVVWDGILHLICVHVGFLVVS